MFKRKLWTHPNNWFNDLIISILLLYLHISAGSFNWKTWWRDQFPLIDGIWPWYIGETAIRCLQQRLALWAFLRLKPKWLFTIASSFGGVRTGNVGPNYRLGSQNEYAPSDYRSGSPNCESVSALSTFHYWWVHGIKFQIPATHYPDMKSMCERLSKACLRKQQLIPLLRTNIGFFERRLTHGWSGNKQKRIILKANYASSGVGSERVILDIHLP